MLLCNINFENEIKLSQHSKKSNFCYPFDIVTENAYYIIVAKATLTFVPTVSKMKSVIGMYK